MAGLNPQQLRALQQMFAQQGEKDEGLVHFRAGLLTLNESTRMVTADKRRGKVKLTKDEQGLLKFQWFDRISNSKELDLTIFPHSAQWEKVPDCTDGRVFLLRMTDVNRKHFFWMQEPKDDKDEEYFTNINKLCQGKSLEDDKSGSSSTTSSAAASNPYAAFGAGGGANSNNAMAQMLLNALSQSGGSGNNNNNNNNSNANNNTNNNNNNSNNNNNASNSSGTDGGGANLLAQMAQMMQQQQAAALEEMKKEPDLEDILDINANPQIAELLDDEKVVEQLAQHLPESMRSRSDLMDQLQSPQFQGSLRRLQSAINGPQMPTLLQQMGITPPSQNAAGVTAFVNAIQPESKEEDKDGDSEMQDSGKEKPKDDADKDKTEENK